MLAPRSVNENTNVQSLLFPRSAHVLTKTCAMCTLRVASRLEAFSSLGRGPATRMIKKKNTIRKRSRPRLLHFWFRLSLAHDISVPEISRIDLTLCGHTAILDCGVLQTVMTSSTSNVLATAIVLLFRLTSSSYLRTESRGLRLGIRIRRHRTFAKDPLSTACSVANERLNERALAYPCLRNCSPNTTTTTKSLPHSKITRPEVELC